MIVMFTVIITSSTTFFILSYGEDVLPLASKSAARLLSETSGEAQSNTLQVFISYFSLPTNWSGFDMLNNFYRIY